MDDLFKALLKPLLQDSISFIYHQHLEVFHHQHLRLGEFERRHCFIGCMRCFNVGFVPLLVIAYCSLYLINGQKIVHSSSHNQWKHVDLPAYLEVVKQSARGGNQDIDSLLEHSCFCLPIHTPHHSTHFHTFVTH